MHIGRFLALIFATSIFMPLCFSVSVARAQDVSTDYADIQDQGIIFANICDSSTAVCDCRDKGECTLADILQVVVNIGTFILAISGSIVLLIFTYGGFLWITARGERKNIDKGKEAMVGAIIGMFIILAAYAAVNLVIGIVKNGEVPTGTIEDTIGGTDVIQTR